MSNATKHSPRPWKVERIPGRDLGRGKRTAPRLVLTDANGDEVAVINTAGEAADDALENAILIVDLVNKG